MPYHDPMPALSRTSIAQLLNTLSRNGDPGVFGDILSHYAKAVRGRGGIAKTPPDLAPFLRWSMKHYTRNCITRNEQFELLVICYNPGQSTSIHDYDSEKAWVLPLFGKLALERFSLNDENTLVHTETQELWPGAVASMSGEDSIHRFYNPGPERAVSLNLYAKPMSRWRVYDEASGISSYTPAGPVL